MSPFTREKENDRETVQHGNLICTKCPSCNRPKKNINIEDNTKNNAAGFMHQLTETGREKGATPQVNIAASVSR
jgi:hypothetical protein